MICMYIALRARIEEFFAQLKLAQQFATSSVRNSKLGYYCTTFEVTLDQILALEKSLILEPGTASDMIEDPLPHFSINKV